MIGLVVTGHGHFADGIHTSAQMIAGENEYVRYINFEEGMTPEQLAEKFNAAFDEFKSCDGVVVLSDLPGGSPFTPSCFLSGAHAVLRLFSLLQRVRQRAVAMKQLALDIGLATGPTLSSFYAGPNEAALQHLRLWAGEGSSQNTRSPVPTYLWGEAGSGKTHLLKAVCEALHEQGASVGWLKTAVEIGAIAGLSSVILVMLMAQPRIFYSMSRDGLLPRLFGKVHPKFHTPYVGTIIVGVLACLLAGFMPLSVLGELVSMGTLLAFATVCLGVLVLRFTRPDLARPFRVPMFWLICPLGALACLALFMQAFVVHWHLFVGWTVLGLFIYFGYGIRNSKLNKQA